MDTEIIKQGVDLIAGQGPVFLGAAGAVAAGLTLLVVSLISYLRGRWSGRRKGGAKPSGQMVSGQHDTYSPAADRLRPAAPAVARTGTGGPDSDQLLLARLRRTTSQLETLKEALRREQNTTAESPLKPTPPAVEYVFKKGIG